MAMDLYEGLLKGSKAEEMEFKEHPELFEDVTVYKDGEAFGENGSVRSQTPH